MTEQPALEPIVQLLVILGASVLSFVIGALANHLWNVARPGARLLRHWYWEGRGEQDDRVSTLVGELPLLGTVAELANKSAWTMQLEDPATLTLETFQSERDGVQRTLELMRRLDFDQLQRDLSSLPGGRDPNTVDFVRRLATDAILGTAIPGMIKRRELELESVPNAAMADTLKVPVDYKKERHRKFVVERGEQYPRYVRTYPIHVLDFGTSLASVVDEGIGGEDEEHSLEAYAKSLCFFYKKNIKTALEKAKTHVLEERTNIFEELIRHLDLIGKLLTYLWLEVVLTNAGNRGLSVRSEAQLETRRDRSFEALDLRAHKVTGAPWASGDLAFFVAPRSSISFTLVSRAPLSRHELSSQLRVQGTKGRVRLSTLGHGAFLRRTFLYTEEFDMNLVDVPSVEAPRSEITPQS